MRPPRNHFTRSSLRALRHGCPFVSWSDAMRRRWWRAKIDAAKARGCKVIFRQSGGQIAEALDNGSAA